MASRAVRELVASLPYVGHSNGRVKQEAKLPHGVLPEKVFPRNIDMRPSTKPDVHAHANRGLRALAVRWELSFNDDPIVLACLKCPGKDGKPCGEMLPSITGGKWSTGKSSGHTRIIVSMHERPVHVVYWCYGPCGKCGRTTTALDGDLLAQLPRRAQDQYDSFPSYNEGTGAMRLSRSMVMGMQFDLVTHEAAEAFADKIRTTLQRLYARDRDIYNEHIHSNKTHRRRLEQSYTDEEFQPFPPFESWVGVALPSPETVFSAYTRAHYSPLSAGGQSIDKALEREMQLMSSGSCMSSDHTYQARMDGWLCCASPNRHVHR